MTEKLRASMQSLREVAGKLNKSTDVANAVIKQVDSYLAKLGVGLAAEVCFETNDEREYNDGEPTGRILRHAKFLTYDRYAGSYQIHITFQTYTVDEFDHMDVKVDSDDHAWGSCSRDLKLSALPSLPGLLEKIAERAVELTAKADAATSLVAEMLSTLDAEVVVEAAPVKRSK